MFGSDSKLRALNISSVLTVIHSDMKKFKTDKVEDIETISVRHENLVCGQICQKCEQFGS